MGILTKNPELFRYAIVYRPWESRPTGGSYYVLDLTTGEYDGPYAGAAQASGHPDFRDMINRKNKRD